MLKLDSHTDKQIEFCKFKKYGYGKDLKWWQFIKKNKKGYVLTKFSELRYDINIPGNFYMPNHVALYLKSPRIVIRVNGDFIMDGHIIGK